MLFKYMIYSLKLNLRKLILLLSVFSVSSLFIVSVVVSYYIQKQQLISNSLSVNLEYASKIAIGTDNHFQTMLKELAYSAYVLGNNFENNQITHSEVERLKNQSDYFNSIVIVNSKGDFIDYAPSQLHLKKDAANTTLGLQESLKAKKTYISAPYYSIRKNLIIFISQPNFNNKKEFISYIGGAIYLKDKNIISDLLTIKYGYKNSYMYVFDKSNKIVFHPDARKIGKQILNNSGLAYMREKKSGSIELINSDGIKNLAGFAHIPTTDWIIVSQQPTKELLQQATTIIYKVALVMLIFYAFIFFIVWQVSLLISSPLNRLAKMASRLNQPNIDLNIAKIEPWYFEVRRFKISLLMSVRNFSEKISELNNRVNTDPLTGFYNRRGMDLFVDSFIKTETKFSVIYIDIDFFKKINDTYGHDQGDVVLNQIASYIRENFRSNDICCRIGGEEFIILTPTTNIDIGYTIAERLRKRLESTMIGSIGPVTVSIGIAHWPNDAFDIQEVFKKADNNLYKAKAAGRNCIR